MTFILFWVLAAAFVSIVILHDRRSKLAAENSLRDTAHGWIAELVLRGFSTREIAMHTGTDQADIDAWSCRVGRVPCAAEIDRLIEMTLEARRAFIHIHQQEIAARALQSIDIG